MDNTLIWASQSFFPTSCIFFLKDICLVHTYMLLKYQACWSSFLHVWIYIYSEPTMLFPFLFEQRKSFVYQCTDFFWNYINAMIDGKKYLHGYKHPITTTTCATALSANLLQYWCLESSHSRSDTQPCLPWPSGTSRWTRLQWQEDTQSIRFMGAPCSTRFWRRDSPARGVPWKLGSSPVSRETHVESC